MPKFDIRTLETPEEMALVEELQRQVWPGSETDVVPAHVLLTVAHNGGLVLGAFDGEKLVGNAWGFPGLYEVPDGPRPKHCSHQLGVLPEYRDSGVGFALKRAQWQMVRQQGLDRITWTYDPLLSRNAYLNIARLGAVCNTYLREVYGEMRDGLNVGLPSDRFQVDWWIHTPRVERRLGLRPRRELTMEHYSLAEIPALYEVTVPDSGLIRPPGSVPDLAGPLALLEIPSDFLALKQADFSLAKDWRFFTRNAFEVAFTAGYLVTDFIYEKKPRPRSLYVLADGESSLSDLTVRK